MNENILRHLPDYGILVCTLCQNNHAVPLEGMGKHFRELHSESISKKQRRELVKYANTFKAVLADPNTVKRTIPAFENGPIDGLHIIAGFQCTTCKKLSPELSSMQIHCRIHGWKEKQPAMWANQWMQVHKLLRSMIDGQTFFTAPQYQNFAVALGGARMKAKGELIGERVIVWLRWRSLNCNGGILEILWRYFGDCN